jgi:hypothetical protein
LAAKSLLAAKRNFLATGFVGYKKILAAEKTFSYDRVANIFQIDLRRASKVRSQKLGFG